MIRIVLVDAQVLVRSGLRALLDAEPDLQVVGEADDAAHGVALTREHRPDVVVIDRPGAVTPGEGTHILVLTDTCDDELVLAALQAGATGLLLKDAAPDKLVGAVRAVASGETLIGSPIARRLIDTQILQPDPLLRRRFDRLTARERDIVRHLAKGLSNAALADRLGLTEGTVKTHITRLLAKLDASNRVHAVVLAYESGFVRPGHACDDPAAGT